jgi:hypothetical protein
MTEPRTISVIAKDKDDLLNALKLARDVGATRIDGTYQGMPIEIDCVDEVEAASLAAGA